MRIGKTLIRLGGCPGWFESLPGAQVVLLVLWCAGSIKCTDCKWTVYWNTKQQPMQLHWTQITTNTPNFATQIFIFKGDKSYRNTGFDSCIPRLDKQSSFCQESVWDDNNSCSKLHWTKYNYHLCMRWMNILDRSNRSGRWGKNSIMLQ